MRNLKLASLLLLPLLGLAQTPAQTAPKVTIRAGKLLDVKQSRVLDDQLIEIQGDKITRITPATEPSIAKAAQEGKLIDLSGFSVFPGLIDCHTHLLGSYDPRKSEDQNMLLTLAQMSTAERALLGARNAREVLEAGITTVRDVGNSGHGGDVALREAIQKGWTPGPRMLVSTRALSPVGGQLEFTSPAGQKLIDEEYAIATGTDEVRKAVRQAFFDRADLIKIIVGYGPRMFTVDELKAIVQETQTGFGKKVAAHAIDEMSIGRAVEAGVNSIEHAYGLTSDKLIRTIAEKKIFLVATEEDPGPKPDQRQIDNGIRLKRVLDAGVPIAFGSDSYFEVKGKTRGATSLRTLHAYKAAGFSSWQILQTATTQAARLLGMDYEIGSLEPGRLADIVAVQGDVLADSTLLDRISFVMKGGQVVVKR